MFTVFAIDVRHKRAALQAAHPYWEPEDIEKAIVKSRPVQLYEFDLPEVAQAFAARLQAPDYLDVSVRFPAFAPPKGNSKRPQRVWLPLAELNGINIAEQVALKARYEAA